MLYLLILAILFLLQWYFYPLGGQTRDETSLSDRIKDNDRAPILSL